MSAGNIYKKTQAIVELTILGTIVLIIFSAIISYGQRFDRMNEVKMKAFRKALNAAWQRNTSVSYTLKEDFRGADLMNFGKGQSLAAAGSSSVLWQKGPAGTADEVDKGETVGSYAFYEVNGKMLGDYEGWDSHHIGGGGVLSLPRYARYVVPKGTPDSVDDSDAVQTVLAPAGIFKEEAVRLGDYQGSTVRTDYSMAKLGITNNEQATVSDEIRTTYHLHHDTSGSTPQAPSIERVLPPQPAYDRNDDVTASTVARLTVDRNVIRPRGELGSGSTIPSQEVRYQACDKDDSSCINGLTALTPSRNRTTK